MPKEHFIFEGKVLLAPLSGVSDSPFRRICRGFGADGVYTEMISSEGLTRKNRRSAELARFTPEEKPIGVQIFGKNPRRMAEAARMIESLGPDLIDINFCCPARRIVSKGAGGALLRQPDLMGEVVRAVVKATRLPVTAKIRIGWDYDDINAVTTVPIIEDAGAAAVAVHGRTVRQGFHGKSDWSRVEEAKKSVGIPVILTGDVMSPEDAGAALEATGCDAVMIGRGSFGRPWIFSQIRDLRGSGTYTEFPPGKMAQVALDHLDLMTQELGERMAVLRFRKHLLWYTKGLYGVVALRLQMSHLHTRSEVAALLDELVGEAETRRSARGEERA
jgi:tRNA-dihydrouridine synthase B